MLPKPPEITSPGNRHEGTHLGRPTMAKHLKGFLPKVGPLHNCLGCHCRSGGRFPAVSPFVEAPVGQASNFLMLNMLPWMTWLTLILSVGPYAAPLVCVHKSPGDNPTAPPYHDSTKQGCTCHPSCHRFSSSQVLSPHKLGMICSHDFTCGGLAYSRSKSC